MKEAELELDKLPKDDLPKEESTDLKFEVSEFDGETTYLELTEDLTEKVIGYIEKEIRGSFEYKKYINYLKTELDLTKCALLPNIDCDAASLEFHHHPFTLYEITDIVGSQMIETLPEGEKVSCFDIAEKVMEEHFRGNVGLIPLTSTLHEMAHNRSIILPMSKVNGNYTAFMKKYASNIDQETKDRIKEYELNSESDESKLYNQLKLEKNVSHYDITYTSDEEESDED